MAIILIVKRVPRRRAPLKAARAPHRDVGHTLMELLAEELVRRLREAGSSMTASELEVVRKLLNDNTVTLSSVRRGDFGDIAQEIAAEYPFGDDDGAAQALVN